MGVFPDSLKKAPVTPIPKEGDICNLSNYRPISVLPVFSNVFEKVAYTQLCDYLKNNSILHNKQYGFHTKNVEKVTQKSPFIHFTPSHIITFVMFLAL